MADTAVSAPVDFETVVVCDLIRQENSGKHILIGAYGINIGVPGFPVDMRLSWWIIVKPRRTGTHRVEFRIWGPRDAQLIAGELGMTIKDEKKRAILRLDSVPVQLQSEGPMQFQIKFAGLEWQTIKSIDVVHRPRPLVAPTPSS